MITAKFEYKNQTIIVNFSDDFFKYLDLPQKTIEKNKKEWLETLCQNAAQTLAALKGSPYEADAIIKVPKTKDQYHGLVRYNGTIDHEFDMSLKSNHTKPIQNFSLTTTLQEKTLDPLEATINLNPANDKKTTPTKKTHKEIIEDKQIKSLEDNKRNFEASIKALRQKEVLIEFLQLLNQQLANRKKKIQETLQQIESEFKSLADHSPISNTIQNRIEIAQLALNQINLLEPFARKMPLERLSRLATKKGEYKKEEQEQITHFLEAMAPVKDYILTAEFNGLAIKNLTGALVLTKTFSDLEKTVNSKTVTYSQEIFANLKVTLADITKRANEAAKIAGETKSYTNDTKELLDENYQRIQKLAQTFSEQHQSLLSTIKPKSSVNSKPTNVNTMEIEKISMPNAPKRNDVGTTSNQPSFTIIPTTKTSEDIKKLAELNDSLNKTTSNETTANNSIDPNDPSSKITLVNYLVSTCLKNLAFWNKQVSIGGAKVSDGKKNYRIPHGIHEMLVYAKNTPDKTADENHAEAFLLGIQDIAKKRITQSAKSWFRYDFGIRKAESTSHLYVKLAAINPSTRTQDLYHQLEEWANQQADLHAPNEPKVGFSMK